jgi:hypothetical protein
LRSSTSQTSRIDWWIIGLRWLILLSVIPVLLLTPATPSTKDNLPETVLILISITAVFNLVAMVLLIFDVPASLLAPAGLIVDTVVAIALLLITGGASSPLFYYTLFPILTANRR